MGNIAEFFMHFDGEETKEEKLCVKDFFCVKDCYPFKKGDVILGYNAILLGDYFISINKIHYYKDSETGLISKYYYGDKKFFDINGDSVSPSNMMKYLSSCDCISNEDAYNKQQEIIKNLPEYVKDNRSGMIFKTEYKPNETYSIKYVNPKFKRCINNINVIIEHYTPSTKEEYDKQEELQQLMDEAQKRYPVGTKLSKDCAVTLHPNNKTYLVYPDGMVSVHIGDDKYWYVKTKYTNWQTEYKEPVKDLKFYEDKFLCNKYDCGFYANLKLKHPNLYYQLILQNIADDLNEGWELNWNDFEMKKFCINYSHRNVEYYIDFNNTVNSLNIYFKSRELAEKAINIITENKLNIIFNIK